MLKKTIISWEWLYWSLQYLGLWNTWWCRWWFQNLRSRWPSLQFSLEKVCTVWNCEVNWKAIWGCWYWSCSPNNIFIVHKKSTFWIFESAFSNFPQSYSRLNVDFLSRRKMLRLQFGFAFARFINCVSCSTHRTNLPGKKITCHVHATDVY